MRFYSAECALSFALLRHPQGRERPGRFEARETAGEAQNELSAGTSGAKRQVSAESMTQLWLDAFFWAFVGVISVLRAPCCTCSSCVIASLFLFLM